MLNLFAFISDSVFDGGKFSFPYCCFLRKVDELKRADWTPLMLAATKTENTQLARLLGKRTRHHKMREAFISIRVRHSFQRKIRTERSKMKDRGLPQCYGYGLDPDSIGSVDPYPDLVWVSLTVVRLKLSL